MAKINIDQGSWCFNLVLLYHDSVVPSHELRVEFTGFFIKKSIPSEIIFLWIPRTQYDRNWSYQSV